MRIKQGSRISQISTPLKKRSEKKSNKNDTEPSKDDLFTDNNKTVRTTMQFAP